MKKENIEMAKEMIKEELVKAMEKSLIIEMKKYDKVKELREIKRVITSAIEKIYNIRVELNVSEEELGRDIDRRKVLLYQKSFNVDRELEEQGI